MYSRHTLGSRCDPSMVAETLPTSTSGASRETHVTPWLWFETSIHPGLRTASFCMSREADLLPKLHLAQVNIDAHFSVRNVKRKGELHTLFAAVLREIITLAAHFCRAQDSSVRAFLSSVLLI